MLPRVLTQVLGVALQGVGNLLFFLVEQGPLGTVQTPEPGVVYLFQSTFGFYLLVLHEITSRKIRTRTSSSIPGIARLHPPPWARFHALPRSLTTCSLIRL